MVQMLSDADCGSTSALDLVMSGHVEQACVQQQWQSVKTSTPLSYVQIVLLLLTLVTIY